MTEAADTGVELDAFFRPILAEAMEAAFPRIGAGLRASYMEFGGGQVVLFPCNPGDIFEDDGYVYNRGKRSRRWCVNPRQNLSHRPMRLWPSRMTDLGNLRRLAVRCEKIAECQQALVSKLLHEYKAAGITAVTYRKKGTPKAEGSIQYEICDDRRVKGELSYMDGRTPPIKSLVDAVVAHAYPEEGAVFHRAVMRSRQLWKRYHYVEGILDIAIRHRIGSPKHEQVYFFEICGAHYVYASKQRNSEYYPVERVSIGASVEKIVIE